MGKKAVLYVEAEHIENSGSQEWGFVVGRA
jgi:hypothetical protein